MEIIMANESVQLPPEILTKIDSFSTAKLNQLSKVLDTFLESTIVCATAGWALPMSILMLTDVRIPNPEVICALGLFTGYEVGAFVAIIRVLANTSKNND